MRLRIRLLLLTLLVVDLGYARQVLGLCGTTRYRIEEDLLRHRQNLRIRQSTGQVGVRAAAAAPAATPLGDLTVLYDTDGVVVARNDFNLSNWTVQFEPSGAGYRVTTRAQITYDPNAGGNLQTGLDDDDSREVALSFRFPFYGKSYDKVYLNSDGNLTFGTSESASTERGLGRMNSGPPRIAALFTDLDPTRSQNGVYINATGEPVVFSWISVPLYEPPAGDSPKTFQIRLFRDGRIEFAYANIRAETPAVVGIAPGNLQGTSSAVRFAGFLDNASPEFPGSIAERFSNTSDELDYVVIGQKFYEQNEDAYDYLVIFNTLGIPDSPGSLASERTVRNSATGFGDGVFDVGRQYGSPGRLQAVINMGPMSQYPNLAVKLRGVDTPLSILAHESGHRYLAFVSYRDPADPRARPMLSSDLAHWAFSFNSDASLLEGNRIRDFGPGTSPRFLTTGAEEHYSTLDQYLMGLRPPAEADYGMFVVLGSGLFGIPVLNISMNGERRDVRIDEIIAAEGRRIPDHTVSQKRYRFAFILVTVAGTQLTEADPRVALLAEFRREFETYFNQRSDGRAFAETSVKRALLLSTFPASGVVRGMKAAASVSIQKPAEADLQVTLTARNGYAGVPGSATIPRGQTRASFEIEGARTGVEELVATPGDTAYMTAVSNVQVLDSMAGLKLVVASGGQQQVTPGTPLPEPVVIRAVDANNLPYPGVRLLASVTAGTVAPESIVTDETGSASFRWTPGQSSVNRLKAEIAGQPASAITVAALTKPSFTADAVVSAVYNYHDIAPGGFATIYGASLSDLPLDAGLPWPSALGHTQVLLNGRAVPLAAVREWQVNFLVPLDFAPGPATVAVRTLLGQSDPVPVTIQPAAPAIFHDAATRYGAIVAVGSWDWTSVRPAERGNFISVYATGLGAVRASPDGLYRTAQPVTVTVAGRTLTADFAGLPRGYEAGGLYQINVELPRDLSTGALPLTLEIGGRRSNEVLVQVR